MEHLSNDPKDGPNQHDNGHKLCDEAGHVLSLTENQWKLRQKMVRISQWRKAIVEQILASEEINPEEQD